MLNGDDSQERLKWLSDVEIKHGHICQYQLAFCKHINTHRGIHFPNNTGYPRGSIKSFPNGVTSLIGLNSIPTT
jgi:hypothetical protein